MSNAMVVSLAKAGPERFGARVRRRPLTQAMRRLGAGGAWSFAGLAIVLLWWPTLLLPLAETWLGDDRHPDATLLQRLGQGGVFYYGAPLIALAAATAAARALRRHGLPVRRSTGTVYLGWALLVAGLVVELLAVRLRIGFLSGGLLPVVCLALLLVSGGWVLLRALWLPLTILAFLGPRPQVWCDPWLAHLHDGTCALAQRLTWAVTGLASLRDERWLYLADSTRLEIHRLCAFQGGTALLVLYALLWAAHPHLRWLARLAMLPVTLATGLVGSTLYVALVIWSCNAATPWRLAPGTWPNLVALGVALLPAILASPAIAWFEARQRRQDLVTPPRLEGALRHIWRSRPAQPPAVAVALIMAAALASLPLARWAAQERCTSAFSRSVMLPALTIAGQSWPGSVIPLPPRSPGILQTDDYAFTSYADPDGVQTVFAFLVFSNTLRNGVHPPNVCQMVFVTDQQDLTVRLPDGTAAPMRALVLADNRLVVYELFAYFYRGAFTRSYSWQQAMTAWSSLEGRPSGGGLVVIGVRVARGDLNRARTLAQEAARQLLPRIARALPR